LTLPFVDIDASQAIDFARARLRSGDSHRRLYPSVTLGMSDYKPASCRLACIKRTNSLLDDIRSAMTLRTWAIERSPQYTARHEESCWQMMRQRFNTTV
jgi:hypothetical protein